MKDGVLDERDYELAVVVARVRLLELGITDRREELQDGIGYCLMRLAQCCHQFDPARGAWQAYLRMVVGAAALNYLESLMYRKNLLIRNAVSLEALTYHESWDDAYDWTELSRFGVEPEAYQIIERMDSPVLPDLDECGLTVHERRVLEAYLHHPHHTYIELAELLGLGLKQIDNALMHCRRKMRLRISTGAPLPPARPWKSGPAPRSAKERARGALEATLGAKEPSDA